MILSIIIPHKNSSALLERLLMSIPSNDEFEVIVVDDNSKKCEKEKAEDFFRRYDTKNRNCTGTSK